MFTQDIDSANTTDLVQCKSELSSYSSRLDKLTERYKESVASPIETEDTLSTIKDITERYNKLHQLKKSFSNKLHSKSSSTEFDKQLKFNKTHLNS